MIVFEHGYEILNHDIEHDGFLVDPIIPRSSIVLFFGESGIGKSRVIFHLADCVQRGEPFLGMRTEQGNVFLLELDMPLVGLKERWRSSGFRPQFAVGTDEITFDCLEFLKQFTDERHERIKRELMDVQHQINPELVVVDALREVTIADLNMSGGARQLYDAFRLVFPAATILFVHHDKKIDSDYQGTISTLNRASGSKEFINNSTVVLTLLNRRGHIFLEHPKSQITGLIDPIMVNAIEAPGRGIVVEDVGAERINMVGGMLSTWTKSKREFDQHVAQELGLSERTVRGIRTQFEEAKR